MISTDNQLHITCQTVLLNYRVISACWILLRFMVAVRSCGADGCETGGVCR